MILFSEDTINRCREKKEIRDKLKKKKSKFDAITLPDAIDQNTGYHSSCFRSYNAVHLKKTDSSSSLMSVDTENSMEHQNRKTILNQIVSFSKIFNI